MRDLLLKLVRTLGLVPRADYARMVREVASSAAQIHGLRAEISKLQCATVADPEPATIARDEIARASMVAADSLAAAVDVAREVSRAAEMASETRAATREMALSVQTWTASNDALTTAVRELTAGLAEQAAGTKRAVRNAVRARARVQQEAAKATAAKMARATAPAEPVMDEDDIAYCPECSTDASPQPLADVTTHGDSTVQWMCPVCGGSFAGQ